MDPKLDESPHPLRPRRPPRNHMLVPSVAVVAVAVAALAAALMSKHGDVQDSQPVVAAPVPRQEVVHAPPLNPTATMGAAPAACQNCGIVESVAAAPDKRFQMRIRMGDGSLRTVERRGALPAGSRVVLEGENLRLLPG